MNWIAPGRSIAASICISLALALPAAGQVIVGRVDVTPSGGSFDEHPKARVVGQSPGAGLFASSGNRGDWAIGVGATPAKPKGDPLPQEKGVLMVSLNELLPREARGGVEVCGKLTTGQASTEVPGSCWVAGFSSAGGVEANHDFALAWFPFSEGWIGAHVARDGQTLLASGNLPTGAVLRRWTLGNPAGEIRLTMPGVNALTDGMLFVVSGENGDNVTAVGPEPDGSAWHIRIADESHDYRREESAPWSFVYIPYRLRGLVGGRVQKDGRVLDGVGEFGVDHTAPGRYEISILDRTGRDGILLLEITQPNDNSVEDNTLAWAWEAAACGGRGGFVVETYDQPTFANQDCAFCFAFIPYNNALDPTRRRGKPFAAAGDWASTMLAADALRDRPSPRGAWWESAWPVLRQEFPVESARLIQDFGERGDLLDFDLAGARPRLAQRNAAMQTDLGALARDLPPHDAKAPLAVLERYSRLARLYDRIAHAQDILWRLEPDLALLLDYPKAKAERLRERLEALRDTQPDLAGEARSRVQSLDAFDAQLASALADLARGKDRLPKSLSEAIGVLRDIAEWADRRIGWTTYGGSNTRSFLSHERLPGQLAVLWRHRPAASPTPAWPPPAEVNYDVAHRLSPTLTFDRAYHPVVVDDRVVYGASGSDAVVCLSAGDGQEVWRFTTEGPVRLTPAVAYGQVYAGADDGRLYCLDLATGREIWRYQAGGTRRLAGNGRIISEQPIRGGICVDQGMVYLTAGLFPKLGVALYAVDARSGREVWKKPISYATQGFMLLSSDRIFVPTGRTPFVMFRRSDGTPIGSLGRSDSWGKSLPGGTSAVVVNETVITGPGEGGTLFGFDTRKSEMVVKTRGRRLVVDGLTAYVLRGNRLTALSRAEYVSGRHPRRIWATPCPSSFSMLKCSDRILVGATDELLVFSAAKGDIVQRISLVGGRVESLAVNRGRVFAAMDDGSIICLGVEPAPAEPPTVPRKRRDPPEVSESVQAQAEAVADWCEVRKGWVLLLGGGLPSALAPALAQSSQCRIVVGAESADVAVGLRKQYAAAGLLGARISVHGTPGPELPYRPYLFNLIVVMGKTNVGAEEIYRVLRPVDGRLAAPAEFVRLPGKRPPGQTIPASDVPGLGFGFRRDAIPGSGAWTDAYVDSRGSVCTNDTLPFAPYRTLWFGRPGPRHMVDRHWKGMTPLYRNGILYVTGRDYLAGVDAYNGTVRWETTIPGSGRVAVLKDCGSATVGPDDRLYIAADAACVVLDGKTGEQLTRLPVSRFTESGADAWWGFVGLSGDRLIGTTTPTAAELSMKRKADYRAIWDNSRPVVTSRSLFGLDTGAFAPAWEYSPAKGVIVNPTLTVMDGKVFFIESTNPATRADTTGQARLAALWKNGPRVTAIDAATGTRLWSVPVNLERFDNTVFMQGKDGVLVLTGAWVGAVNGKRLIQYRLIGMNAADGGELWRNDNTPSRADRVSGGHGEQTQHPVIVRDVVYGPGFARMLRTGAEYGGWKWDKSPQCSPMSASLYCAFSRQGGHPTAAELATGRQQALTQVTRPSCWLNILPVGGIILVPEGSSGCTCGYSIQTSLAFYPESDR